MKTKKTGLFRNKVFTFSFLINILTALSFHILSPTIPKYVDSLGFTADIVGVIVTMFTVTSIITRPLSSKLIDKKSKSVILAVSLGLIFISCMGYAFSTTIPAIIACRLLHGIGWGLNTTANSTIASESLPPEQLGSGLGIFGMASSLASAVAPNLGLQLAGKVGYRNMFLIASSFAFAGILLTAGLVHFSSKQPQSAKKKEEIAEIPMLKLLKRLAIPAITMVAVGLAVSSISTFIALLADERSISNVGYYFTVTACTMLVTRPAFGKLNDRYPALPIVAGCGVTLALTFLLIGTAKSLLPILAAGLLYGIGYGGIQPTIQVWCVRLAGKNSKGLANSIFYTAMDVGYGIGGIVAGQLAYRLGYGTMYIAMIVPMVLVALIALVSFIGHKKGDEVGEKQNC